ncbi:hypothetical protein EB796_010071 [Bugula neritina]|uniref:ShKT domain-containing protein n=1 Tax=Bugula neritina TaxID=10212 RepID=A0A7J7JZ05_BUGNE|nr:hypothetical protein EB796_010071 [Bugula neritina]
MPRRIIRHNTYPPTTTPTTTLPTTAGPTRPPPLQHRLHHVTPTAMMLPETAMATMLQHAKKPDMKHSSEATVICSVDSAQRSHPVSVTTGPCLDTEDCSKYTDSTCVQYPDWAKRTCPQRCGLCIGDNPDKEDCTKYGLDMCTDYKVYARENCPLYCKLCTSTVTTTKARVLTKIKIVTSIRILIVLSQTSENSCLTTADLGATLVMLQPKFLLTDVEYNILRTFYSFSSII